MMNVSYLNNNTIQLRKGDAYVVIDAVYLVEVKNKIKDLDTSNLLHSIRQFAFPYTDTPFAEFIASESVFSIEKQIKKVDYSEVLAEDKSFFSSDTGMIVVIEKNQLIRFAQLFDYEVLVDSVSDIINLDYWQELAEQFETATLGLLLSHSEDDEEILNGGGTFQIR